MSEKIIITILLSILFYLTAFIIILPFWGTLRCKNWVIENQQPKCDKLTIGFINPYYKFDSSAPLIK